MMAEFTFEGQVSRIAFDYGIEFLFADGAVVRVEGGGKLLAGTTEPQDVDPATPIAAAQTLLGLLRAEVTVSLEDSTLIVALADGRIVLEIPPSADHEAWTVTMPDGSLFVCGVDQTVTAWSRP